MVCFDRQKKICDSKNITRHSLQPQAGQAVAKQIRKDECEEQ
jgi:hypothetical protein